MGTFIDMSGQIIKNWLVIKRGVCPHEKNASKSAWWDCQCQKCGRLKTFNGSELRLNRIGECRCDKTKPKKIIKHDSIKIKHNNVNVNCPNNCKDETNNKYGKLLVQSFAYTKNGFAYWNCICDCGNMKIVRGNSLRTGRIQSCGCNVSRKEEEIVKILNNCHLTFKREYSFNDLVDKAKLRFDFAIFKNEKIFGLIEYQGRQHFSSPERYNAYGRLQFHDKMKQEYCKRNNIPLLILDKNSDLETEIIQWVFK